MAFYSERMIIFPFLNRWTSGTISVLIALEMENPVRYAGSDCMFFVL